MKKINAAKLVKHSASDIAKYFIWKASKEGKPMTNKKLQKLLYYAQAWHLVFNEGAPLFKENIEAWIHGPVIPGVYNSFKAFGFSPITLKIDDNPVNDKAESSFLDQVWNVYGGFDAEYLEMLSHREEPWQKARENVGLKERSNAIIDLEVMRKFYESKLNAAQL